MSYTRDSPYDKYSYDRRDSRHDYRRDSRPRRYDDERSAYDLGKRVELNTIQSEAVDDYNIAAGSSFTIRATNGKQPYMTDRPLLTSSTNSPQRLNDRHKGDGVNKTKRDALKRPLESENVSSTLRMSDRNQRPRRDDGVAEVCAFYVIMSQPWFV